MGISLLKKLRVLEVKFANDADFKKTFLDYIRRAYIASLYQEETDVNFIIKIYAKKIAAFLYNRDIIMKGDQHHLAGKLTNFLKKNLNEDVVFNYFATQIIPKDLSFSVQNILNIIDNIYDEIYTEIRPYLSQPLINNIRSIQQLRRDYFAELTREDFNNLKYNGWSIVPFFFLNATIIYSNWNNEIYNYTREAWIINLWLTFSTGLTAYVGYKSYSFLAIVNNLVQRTEHNKLAFFNLENFIAELEQEKNEQEVVTNVNKRYELEPTTIPPLAEAITLNDDSDSEITPKSKTKTRPNYATMFYNQVRRIISPAEIMNWRVKYQETILEYSIPEKILRSLKKGTPKTPLIEETKWTLLDEDSIKNKEHVEDFKKIHDEATFHPGAAQQSCVHYLGNDIWSLKSKNTGTKNRRIVGTVVGTAGSRRTLIVFCRDVDHKKLEKKLEDPIAFKRTLTNLAIKTLEKKQAPISNENNIPEAVMS